MTYPGQDAQSTNLGRLHPGTTAQSMNRRFWDAAADLHGQDRYYDVDAIRAGGSSLFSIETDLAGEVVDQDLLHVQCHIGHDTLSWARRGARVTGVDFSPVALGKARALADELHIPARFVQADATALPDDLAGAFDVAVATYGVLCWIQDVGAWARAVARTLRSDGRLILVDFHPLLLMIETVDPLVLVCPYANRGPLVLDGTDATYAGVSLPSGATTTVEFTHSLGEIVTAIAAAGLRIEVLGEHLDPRLGCPSFEHLLDGGEDGRYRLHIGGQDLPVLYSVRARKPD